MEFVLATIERHRLLVPLPFRCAKFKATFLELMPKPLLTRDQVELLRYDNVVSDEARRDGRTLEGIGIVPRAVEAIVRPIFGAFARPASSAAARRSLSPARTRRGRSARESCWRLNPRSPVPIRPSVPTPTRHQANTSKPCPDT